MKVISLIQPWASLVVKGFKNVENRSWQTWIRGEVAACQRERTSPWHFDGNWGFYLRNPKEFKEPIFAKGKLGFWDFDIPKDSPKIHLLVQREIDKLNADMEDLEKGGAK